MKVSALPAILGLCPICKRRRKLAHVVFVPAAEESPNGTMWVCSLDCVNLYFELI
ncbi:MAG: hypothetical protein HYV63_31560 [Candidatus Schekmanbacteria bacterium]|nr:hypothetical protein [Candidatus Schekmanbacteria bacterium]